MTDKKKIVCPNCGQADRVEKVSTIYISGIDASRLAWLAKSGADIKAPPSPVLAEIPTHVLRQFSRKLEPPSSGRGQALRSVHPDLIVLAFTGILPVFLAGVAADQRGLLIPILAVIFVFYVFYAIRRKSLVNRYDLEKEARKNEAHRIQRAIGRWMNLYYCFVDDGVFEKGKGDWTPADQMVEMLLKDK